MINKNKLAGVLTSTIGLNILTGVQVWAAETDESEKFQIKDDVLISVDDVTSDTLAIPDGVKEIGSGAFSGSGVKNVIIPDSVTVIDSEAFAYASNLTSVKMGNSVGIIKEHAFAFCNNLRDIKLSESLTTIEKFAFFGCGNLTKVNIPNSVVSISEGVFPKECSLIGSGENFEKAKAQMNAEEGNSFYLDLHRYNNGWITTYDGHKCYKLDNETLQKGWMDLDGKRYYFYGNGWQLVFLSLEMMRIITQNQAQEIF